MLFKIDRIRLLSSLLRMPDGEDRLYPIGLEGWQNDYSLRSKDCSETVEETRVKILVVEDEALVLETLQLLLSRYGYAVDTAQDGETGLEFAIAYEYDLLILDVLLPKLDGVSLCHRLREKGMQTPILGSPKPVRTHCSGG